MVLNALAPRSVLAWDLFRSENADVKRGNALLGQGKAQEATAAFDAAQRSLPNDPGVQLNRGLGLMASGDLPQAREAFRAAAQGSAAAPDLRSKAHYNTGLAFLGEADALAKEEKLEEAQKFLTESVDAFKNALRANPRNTDAAWNMELTKRRLVELQKKKQEKDEQQKKDQEKQDKDKQNDDQDKQNDDQDKQGNDQDKQGDQDKESDQDKQGKQQDGQAPKDPQSDGKAPEDKKEQAGSEPKAPEKKAESQPQPPQPASPSEQTQSPGTPPKGLPEHMERALDALSESDDNLQKQRARARARQRPMRIEKDW